MIPGPVEFEPSVMRVMGSPTTSHVAPSFINSFGRSLEMMRAVWQSPAGQPFIMAGTGTLAMDMAGANLTEPGDNALVISTGYFGDRYADLLRRYGADVTVLSAEFGDTIPVEMIEKELRSKRYKLLTFTHVDTSSAVLVNPEPIGALGKKYDVLTILDGVCSVAGEEIKQDEWGIDIVLTASQKAVGVPPGLALLVASERAMESFARRKTPVGSYYADWTNWLPIMKAYEERRPSYFGTPAVNLVAALEVSLDLIINEGLEKRFARHTEMAQRFRSSINEMGLEMVPQKREICANTLSAPLFPKGMDGAAFMSEMAKSDVIVAGGLHPEHKSRYFRVGHMGSVNNADITATLNAIEKSLEAIWTK